MRPALLDYIRSMPWAIQPTALRVLVAEARSEAPIAVLAGPEPQTIGNVAVLPLQGVVTYKPGLFSSLFGGAVLQTIAPRLRAAVSDPAIKSIILAVDSPGGSVTGVSEFAEEVRAARAVKPVFAIADTTMASAAYWIAAQATQVWAMPSADVGSVGVFAVHEDFSRALDQAGVTVTLVSAGEHKTDGNPYEPLSEPARADLQARVDEVYAQFVADVAAGRGVSVQTVRESFGGGKVFSAKDALANGLIDKIGTMSTLLGRASTGRRPAMRAEDEIDLRARRLRLA